jgi:inositol oxygenase
MLGVCLVGFGRQAKLYYELLRISDKFAVRHVVCTAQERLRLNNYLKSSQPICRPLVITGVEHCRDPIVIFGDRPARRDVLKALNQARHVIIGCIECLTQNDLAVMFRTAVVNQVMFLLDTYHRRSSDLAIAVSGVTAGDEVCVTIPVEEKLLALLDAVTEHTCADIRNITLERGKAIISCEGSKGVFTVTFKCHDDANVRLDVNGVQMLSQPLVQYQVQARRDAVEALYKGLFGEIITCSMQKALQLAAVREMIKTCDTNVCHDIRIKRVYDVNTSPQACVELYRKQRLGQNLHNSIRLMSKYAIGGNARMTMWEALQKLRLLVDESDPDLDLPNDVHALQTATMMENDGLGPLWVVTGLIHDVGKVLYLFGNDVDGTSADTQWAVVGDTFVTGCHIPSSVPFPEFNALNLDHALKTNRWKSHAGLSNVICSFGHDEYLFHVLHRNREKHSLPPDFMYIIRFHSLYAWHTHGEYAWLEDNLDRRLKPLVQLFQSYDLYSKSSCTDNLSWRNPKWRALVEQVFGTEPYDW